MELNAEATVSIGFGNVNGSKRVALGVVVNTVMVFVYMDPGEAREYAKSLVYWAGVLEHDPFTPPCEACPKGVACAVYGEPFKCVKPHAPVDAEDPVPSFYEDYKQATTRAEAAERSLAEARKEHKRRIGELDLLVETACESARVAERALAETKRECEESLAFARAGEAGWKENAMQASKALGAHRAFVAAFDAWNVTDDANMDSVHAARAALPPGEGAGDPLAAMIRDQAIGPSPAKTCETCKHEKGCGDAGEPITPRSSIEECWRAKPSPAKTCETCTYAPYASTGQCYGCKVAAGGKRLGGYDYTKWYPKPSPADGVGEAPVCQQCPDGCEHNDPDPCPFAPPGCDDPDYFSDADHERANQAVDILHGKPHPAAVERVVEAAKVLSDLSKKHAGMIEIASVNVDLVEAGRCAVVEIIEAYRAISQPGEQRSVKGKVDSFAPWHMRVRLTTSEELPEPGTEVVVTWEPKVKT